MKIFRLLLSVAVASWMTGVGQYGLAQETDTSPFSITLAPLQYANVKGNVGKFEALNWMPNGAVEGVNNISFVKDINKDISLNIEGSEFTNDNGTAHLTLKDGDLAFLKIDYNAFRKYYDNTGGVDRDVTFLSSSDQGAKANSPDLQLDISKFKLEAGLGEISDPYLDVVYEHDSKNGDKSLLQWAGAYYSALGQKLIAPAYQAVNDYTDTVTLSEKKKIAGITVKGQQTAEIDYNSHVAYMQYLDSSNNQLLIQNESPDAKLFGSGIRFEKWMLNDNTFAAVGYHYNHIHNTDLMQNQSLNSVTGALYNPQYVHQSLWSFSKAREDEHVITGNFDSNLTPNLTFITDARYEHMGSEGDSTYYSTSNGTTPTATDIENMQNHQDHEGEHVALRYYGIPHTSLYAESSLEQERNWVDQGFNNVQAALTGSDFTIERLDRTQKESWTVGGRVVPNRFFIFSTQVKQRWEDNRYDTVALTGTPTDQTFLDSLKINGIEESSTLTWKPYRWIQNSLKYQFIDANYFPQEAAEGTAVSGYGVTKNHMLTSDFTYDITVEPIDPLMLMLSYSHVENFVRTIGASSAGGVYIPTFNSGDNSWLFSGSYTPTENLVLTNTVCYTLSNNYVDFSTGVPYGSDFKMLNFTTGLDWTYHKWLKLGPEYEYASYRDNSLTGTGNYSANIFMLTTKFSW